MNRAEEQQLVQSARQGDRQAFGVLYIETVDRISRFIKRRIEDTQLAEDLTSDVYVHALAAIYRYEDREKPFIAWLYCIARTRVADYYRRLSRDPEIIHLDDVYVTVLPKMDTRIMEQELAEYLVKVIVALTEDQQQVVILRFAEERPIKEVARIIHKQPNAVKQLQHRALRSVEQHLAEEGQSAKDMLEVFA